MAKTNYPSPCLSCDKTYCRNGGSNYKECAAWLKWFRWWWRHFRKQYAMSGSKQEQCTTKFRYDHPDHVRRYLIEGPCHDCKISDVCDTPCGAYLRWYDARMAIARRRAGL